MEPSPVVASARAPLQDLEHSGFAALAAASAEPDAHDASDIGAASQAKEAA